MKLIRIKRSRCPTVLKNATADSDRYRHPKVVSKLWKMQSGKCCYCEQKIPEKGHAKAVEHFAPKSVFEDRRNHWPNLLLACAQCNGKKADQFPEMLTDNPDEVKLIYVNRSNKKATSKKVSALIDPTKETNPEAHLTYHLDLHDGCLVGQIYPRNGSPQGKATISVIGLDQAHIHRLRRDHFRTLVISYINLQEARDENRREVLRQKFEKLISRDGVFAGLAREFSREYKIDDEYGLDVLDIT